MYVYKESEYNGATFPKNQLRKDLFENEDGVGVVEKLGEMEFNKLQEMVIDPSGMFDLTNPTEVFNRRFVGEVFEHPFEDEYVVEVSHVDEPAFIKGWNKAEYLFLNSIDSIESSGDYNIEDLTDENIEEIEARHSGDRFVKDELDYSGFYPRPRRRSRMRDLWDDERDYTMGNLFGSRWGGDTNRIPQVPSKVFGRFDKKDDSDKIIRFNKEESMLFWDVFLAANKKEIMFFSEIEAEVDNPNVYNVKSINFPPQKNFGAYVETVDGEFEKWLFNDIVLKGKKIPLHVHTHPDFSPFSSGVDERQISKFIEDNEGNPFVIQLVVSNPYKKTYFVRWFDLENDTWETPKVEFDFGTSFDVEESFPGIFQFNATRESVNTNLLTKLEKLVAGEEFDYDKWLEENKDKENVYDTLEAEEAFIEENGLKDLTTEELIEENNKSTSQDDLNNVELE